MKIALVEERGGSFLQEKTFDRDIVRFGRDPENCQLIFEQKMFPMVSRRHAELRETGDGRCFLIDNDSSFGTILNGTRISQPTEIRHGAVIQLGTGGPVLHVRALAVKPAVSQPLPQSVPPIAAAPPQPKIEQSAPPRPKPEPPAPPAAAFSSTGNLQPATLLGAKLNVQDYAAPQSSSAPNQPQLLLKAEFNGKQELTVGRGGSNDIRLDGLQISKNHARFVKTANGVAVEDANSTNGVYFGGKRIAGRQILTPQDTIQIGAFQLRVDNAGAVCVFDTRSKTRIDALHVSKTVRNRNGGGDLKLLDDVSLTIQPNEFVGLIGPSGAGKSTLMDALNGMRPPTAGNVFLNSLDFYDNLDALKQGVGYVPQDDIIHRELTVYKTLYYIAKLRLSSDVSGAEIEQIVSEVLDVTGLAERRDVCVSDLSGGQRKRVSIAVELITKPSVIFLDEPTSGLDPATEDKIMKLFRRIAESGRTVILTTHAMENVRLFDKIVILMRGKLAFYGTPSEALKHTGAANFKELYDKLEAPIDAQLAQSTNQTANDFKRRRAEVTERVAEDWKLKFQKTEQFRRNVHEPLSQMTATHDAKKRAPKRNLGIFGAIRQTLTLARRYAGVLWQDKLNLAILLLQAPIIALMTAVVVTANLPRDFIYFILSLVAVWFGTSVAAREIVRERAVLRRERMVNLGLIPYLTSKLAVLGFIVALQCLLLFVPLKFFDLVGLVKMPGAVLPQLFVMFLTAFVGLTLGLLISALVKTSEMATSLVPLILIPQILFSGLVGVPAGLSKVVGLTMPAAWSFDSMKRFSNLDTLEPEGSDLRGANEGFGLYKAVEKRNEEIADEIKEDIDDYKNKMKNYLADVKEGLKRDEPPPPAVRQAEKLPANLSEYVAFLHPWMRTGANEIVLLVMFGAFLLATLIVLRSQDIR